MRTSVKMILAVLLWISFFGLVSCTQQEPVSDLSLGQEGKIRFYSSCRSFKDLFSNKGTADSVVIEGKLTMPEVIVGKVPAVIILHTATGLTGPGAEHYAEVARTLNKMGIAAFVVDSHKTRNIKSLKDGLTQITWAERVADAYAALNLLSTHPKIDSQKVAVMGFAGGGTVSLFSASKQIRNSLALKDLKFSAHIALYPDSFCQLKRPDLTGAPILLLLGEKDNLAPVAKSLSYAKRLKSSAVPLKVVVFDEAYHAFDFAIVAGSKMPYFMDMTSCQDRTFLLNEDGTWYSAYYDRTADRLADFGDFTADCRSVDKQGTIGGPVKARMDAIKAYQSFLREVFKLS
ncbi:MAG: dienelactone hydrolase family protein [Geobacteraceae bacterium]|nr:dienelactone hydrolase family protein [Geobacteraceae bacterium]